MQAFHWLEAQFQQWGAIAGGLCLISLVAGLGLSLIHVQPAKAVTRVFFGFATVTAAAFLLMWLGHLVVT